MAHRFSLASKSAVEQIEFLICALRNIKALELNVTPISFRDSKSNYADNRAA